MGRCMELEDVWLNSVSAVWLNVAVSQRPNQGSEREPRTKMSRLKSPHNTPEGLCFSLYVVSWCFKQHWSLITFGFVFWFKTRKQISPIRSS